MLKKKLLIVSSVLVLCSMLLVLNLGTSKAHVQGYDYIEYDAVRTPTIDGMWTTQDEWTDAQVMQITDDAVWLTKTSRVGGLWQYILVEIFTETTNDGGDYWLICVDDTHDGGTGPNTNDVQVRILAHSTLEVYTGTATGTWQRDLYGGTQGVSWANSLSASPLNSTAHYILEVRLDMDGWYVLTPPPHGIFVGEYDVSRGSLTSWPPTSPDIPDQWGTMTAYAGAPIPEGFGLVVIVLLSSAVAIVGFRYQRKHPKTKTLTTIKP